MQWRPFRRLDGHVSCSHVRCLTPRHGLRGRVRTGHVLVPGTGTCLEQTRPVPGTGCLEESVLGGSDLDLAGADARLVARLRIDRRPAAHLARAEVEAGAVPWAGDDVAVALAVVQRAAEVRARRCYRAHLAALLGARDDDRFALELYADELAAVEVALVAHRRVPVARVLERRPVDADSEPEREMPAEMCREERAGVGDTREHAAEAAVPVLPRGERGDVQREAHRVE